MPLLLFKSNFSGFSHCYFTPLEQHLVKRLENIAVIIQAFLSTQLFNN